MLLRVHGGYQGVTDDALLAMPYARLLQEIRLAGEAKAAEERAEWRRSAFIGWQTTSAIRGAFGAKTPPLAAWMRQFGLGEDASITRAERERDIAKSKRIAARFDELASVGGVVKA